MKKFVLINFIVPLLTACLFVSCDESVTDDKGVVQSVETTTAYGKKYHVEVRIKCSHSVLGYDLYTNTSYRVGDSIYIK